jgi:hypothetical protein
VDQGWLRLFGSPLTGAPDGLFWWNGVGAAGRPDPEFADAIVVGADVVGGFFAANQGALEGPTGEIWYFSPVNLGWEARGIDYLGLLRWLASRDFDDFYRPLRWPGWQREIAALRPDQGLLVYPFLSAAGGAIEKRSRTPVPLRELWTLQWELLRQIGDLENGTEYEVRIRRSQHRE